VAFGKISKVIAFDVNPARIESLKKGHDTNDEVTDADLSSANIHFTTLPEDLKAADFHIVAVPTPVGQDRNPDLSLLLKASDMLGKRLKKGDIVVYESSVYPGVTEEKCIPVLEKSSGLRCGSDFFVGFSPERINPADKIHTLETIPKVISGIDPHTVDILAEVYSSIVKPGVHRAPNIRTAEAIKIIENIQRDINIAYMNEISIILHRLGIDTADVIAGMKTKWNFVPFKPGLVGGHCIGVNAYYLLHKAEEIGYHSNLIMASRLVNEGISKFIASEAIKKLIQLDVPVRKARVAIFGLTYKENCSDLRDTKVIDIIHELQSYGIQVMVHDPIADALEAQKEYHITLAPWANLKDLDAILLTVSHKTTLEKFKKIWVISCYMMILEHHHLKLHETSNASCYDSNALFHPDYWILVLCAKLLEMKKEFSHRMI
jgi:UDP-N-acetyl-D-galactosamine dehydrogenase